MAEIRCSYIDILNFNKTATHAKCIQILIEGNFSEEIEYLSYKKLLREKVKIHSETLRVVAPQNLKYIVNLFLYHENPICFDKKQCVDIIIAYITKNKLNNFLLDHLVRFTNENLNDSNVFEFINIWKKIDENSLENLSNKFLLIAPSNSTFKKFFKVIFKNVKTDLWTRYRISNDIEKIKNESLYHYRSFYKFLTSKDYFFKENYRIKSKKLKRYQNIIETDKFIHGLENNKKKIVTKVNFVSFFSLNFFHNFIEDYFFLKKISTDLKDYDLKTNEARKSNDHIEFNQFFYNKDISFNLNSLLTDFSSFLNENEDFLEKKITCGFVNSFWKSTSDNFCLSNLYAKSEVDDLITRKMFYLSEFNISNDKSYRYFKPDEKVQNFDDVYILLKIHRILNLNILFTRESIEPIQNVLIEEFQNFKSFSIENSGFKYYIADIFHDFVLKILCSENYPQLKRFFEKLYVERMQSLKNFIEILHKCNECDLNTIFLSHKEKTEMCKISSRNETSELFSEYKYSERELEKFQNCSDLSCCPEKCINSNANLCICNCAQKNRITKHDSDYFKGFRKKHETYEIDSEICKNFLNSILSYQKIDPNKFNKNDELEKNSNNLLELIRQMFEFKNRDEILIYDFIINNFILKIQIMFNKTKSMLLKIYKTITYLILSQKNIQFKNKLVNLLNDKKFHQYLQYLIKISNFFIPESPGQSLRRIFEKITRISIGLVKNYEKNDNLNMSQIVDNITESLNTRNSTKPQLIVKKPYKQQQKHNCPLDNSHKKNIDIFYAEKYDQVNISEKFRKIFVFPCDWDPSIVFKNEDFVLILILKTIGVTYFLNYLNQNINKNLNPLLFVCIYYFKIGSIETNILNQVLENITQTDILAIHLMKTIQYYSNPDLGFVLDNLEYLNPSILESYEIHEIMSRFESYYEFVCYLFEKREKYIFLFSQLSQDEIYIYFRDLEIIDESNLWNNLKSQSISSKSSRMSFYDEITYKLQEISLKNSNQILNSIFDCNYIYLFSKYINEYLKTLSKIKKQKVTHRIQKENLVGCDSFLSGLLFENSNIEQLIKKFYVPSSFKQKVFMPFFWKIYFQRNKITNFSEILTKKHSKNTLIHLFNICIVEYTNENSDSIIRFFEKQENESYVHFYKLLLVLHHYRKKAIGLDAFISKLRLDKSHKEISYIAKLLEEIHGIYIQLDFYIEDEDVNTQTVFDQKNKELFQELLFKNSSVENMDVSEKMDVLNALKYLIQSKNLIYIDEQNIFKILNEKCSEDTFLITQIVLSVDFIPETVGCNLFSILLQFSNTADLIKIYKKHFYRVNSCEKLKKRKDFLDCKNSIDILTRQEITNLIDQRMYKHINLFKSFDSENVQLYFERINITQGLDKGCHENLSQIIEYFSTFELKKIYKSDSEEYNNNLTLFYLFKLKRSEIDIEKFVTYISRFQFNFSIRFDFSIFHTEEYLKGLCKRIIERNCSLSHKFLSKTIKFEKYYVPVMLERFSDLTGYEKCLNLLFS